MKNYLIFLTLFFSFTYAMEEGMTRKKEKEEQELSPATQQLSQAELDNGLIQAIKNRAFDKIKFYLDQGANPNTKELDKTLFEILSSTAAPSYQQGLPFFDFYAARRLLLAYGYRPTLIKEKFMAALVIDGYLNPYSPDDVLNLAGAALLGNIEQIQNLLANIPENIRQQNIVQQGNPAPQPLTTAQASYPNINQQDVDGMAALHWAAAQGHTEIVKLLLHHGANWALQNKNGLTAWKIAIRNKHFDTADAITDYITKGSQLIMLRNMGLPDEIIEQIWHFGKQGGNP